MTFTADPIRPRRTVQVPDGVLILVLFAVFAGLLAALPFLHKLVG